MTQLDLANKLERQPTQVSRWERDTSEPSVADLWELSHALNVPIMALLNGEAA